MPAKGSAAMSGERPIGSFGRAGVFGFYPNKQITTGEGGMIVTDDDRLRRRLPLPAQPGPRGNGVAGHQRLGYNYRLSEINAALGVAAGCPARRNPRQPPPRRAARTSSG